MRDFTFNIYYQLLQALQSEGFSFVTFRDYAQMTGNRQPATGNGMSMNPPRPPLNPRGERIRPDREPTTDNSETLKRETLKRFVLLRHDVDRLPLNSLRFARIQAEMGVNGTYYFRMVPASFDEKIIREIASLGHEIGYHYETMDTCRGDVDKAWDEFHRNLDTFRNIVHIDTICMHGSPLSRYDNRAIWNKYDYRSLGLIAEPYFNVDFNEVAYYTDTGRRWDGERVSVRDRMTDNRRPMTDVEPRTLNPELRMLNLWPKYHSTHDMISSLNANSFPPCAMLTFHPQRWTDGGWPWLRELAAQNLKNGVKYLLIRGRQ